MSTDTETVVRAAYRAAEGTVLDVQGFRDLFTEDGVFNNVGTRSAALARRVDS
ncbi:hypothetical protein [Streptomyces sp. NBC_00212]|uniref:hypothetical protein n=1 Tax=Streptomyces sp. NBC_00212 TaxID=2975684 RepID=UPI00324B887C